MKDQCNKADRGVGSNALWQSVVDGADLNLVFQDPEAAFDISQGFVSGDDFRWRQIGDVAHQQ